MAAKASGLGKALRIGALLLAGLGAAASQAQGLMGTPPVKSKAPTGAPTISGNPSRMLVAGSFYDFRPVASDPNGDKLTFSINKLPRWATFDAATGRLYGTPVTTDVGKIKGIRITVSDGVNQKSLAKFGIKVIAGKAPKISGAPDTSAREGQVYTFQPTATDNDQQPLRFAIINKPTWAAFDVATGRLAGTPPKGSAGPYANVGISVTDGANTASLAAFTIKVEGTANNAPQIAGTPPASVEVGQSYDFVPAAADADGDALRFAVANPPSWATFDSATGRLTGKPGAGSEGAYPDIVISVSDGKLMSFLPPFTITVLPAGSGKGSGTNHAPTIEGVAPSTATEGAAYAFQPTASDADGDALTFGAANLPAWLAVNAATGRVAGTPPAGSAGTYAGLVVTVSDGKAQASLAPFTIVVTRPAVNTPPKISGSPPPTAREGELYTFTPTGSDADGDAIAFGVANAPAWANFDTKTGRLSGSPPSGSAGVYAGIVLSVSDGKDSATLAPFAITVSAAAEGNHAPTISGVPPRGAVEGTAYVFVPTASDADGDPLTFRAVNVPAWLSFNSATGLLSGTPPAGSAGTYAGITLSVSDGKDSSALPSFSITVTATANHAPTISGAPSSIAKVGLAYTFTPTASDADGQPLSFGIANQPSWATFDVATGTLAGTPAEGDVGTYANIVISVSDGIASATLPAFAIVVPAVSNTPPSISGTPPTDVSVGKLYSFTPKASDPDGQVLAFGIANKPGWANFNTTTGKLSGTPADTHVGTYSNIVISVSDGVASATLPAFSITVNAVGTGTADLSWVAPTQNEDGSPLVDLAGFKVRYGSSPDTLTRVLDVVGAAITSATVEGLTVGTWYFSVSAYTSVGVESTPAGPVSKTIQ